ncbi:MAG: S8 family serine peptidase [Acidobacteria bacterium]|nr:S8 family serine peptidase [Acidobacteriota bacterium]
MNRHNFLGHLALALTVILVAAFAGQLKRWERGRDYTRPTGKGGAILKSDKQPVLADVYARPRMPEVLVRFKQNLDAEAEDRIAESLHDHVVFHASSVKGLTEIDDLDDADPETVAEQYRQMKDEVEYAEVNYNINLEPEVGAFRNESSTVNSSGLETPESGKLPNDPMFNEQWSLQNTGQRGGKAESDIKALLAWEQKGTGSEKVVVAVLDSGVDYNHQDLQQNIWQRPDNIDPYHEDAEFVDDQYGYDATTDSGDPMDDNGHGTHCAGIIGADGNNGVGIAGINWRVQIMPLKFISRNGSGSTGDAIKAINYVINRRQAGVNVRIISASWGSTQKSKALEDVIRAANDAGILFVAAAGNASADADKNPHYPASFDQPNVISVASVDRNDQLSSFSNYGAKRVHIAAPGSEILSTWLNNDFREASGTSMATPEVAGVAALILASNPDMTVAELKARLLKSVDKLPSLDGKVSSGGRLNAARAVGAE